MEAELHSAIARHDWVAARRLSEDLIVTGSPEQRVGYYVHAANVAEKTRDYVRERDCALRAHELVVRWWRAASERRAVAPPPRALCFFVANTLHLATEPARALEVLDLYADDGSDRAWTSMRSRLRFASQAAARLEATQVAIIPAGQSCIPENLPKRWGMGRHVVDGPMAGGLFYGDGPAKAMETGFVSFLDPGAYRIVKSQDGLDVPTLPAYDAVLNHEIGSYWTEDGLSRLLALYSRRIADLETLGTRPLIFFTAARYPLDFARLFEAIRTFANGRPFRHLIADYSAAGDASRAVSDNAQRVIFSPLPREDYVWHADFNSEEGLAFERPIAEALEMLAIELASELTPA